MSSSSIRLQSTPAAPISDLMRAWSCGCRSCRADRLTDTGPISPPACCQAFRSSQARRMAHSPTGRMSPVSSRIGMNSWGETMPRSGCLQRSSPSAPLVLGDISFLWRKSNAPAASVASRRSGSPSPVIAITGQPTASTSLAIVAAPAESGRFRSATTRSTSALASSANASDAVLVLCTSMSANVIARR